MTPTTLPQHDVVLLGIGHTNAHVLRMWRMQPIPNARLTCISNYPVATYSGMLPGVLAVAASTETNTLAGFSTYGSWVQVAAPGERILSSIPGGGYATWSGTSMAAPLAAGSAALVRAAYPSLRPTDIVTRLITTSAPLAGSVRRRVDAAAALRLSVAK